MDDQESADAASGHTPDPAAEVAMLIDAFFAALDKRFPDEGCG